MKPETERWIQLYLEDRQVAGSALRDGVFRQSVFHSQQMVEKVLKAIWVEEKTEGYPPKEHKLVPLARGIGLQLDDEDWEFLDDLTKQYNPTRYGDVMLEYSKEHAERYCQRAAKLCDRLLLRLS